MEHCVTIDLPIYDKQTLCLNSFGHSVTEPGHRYGPGVRSHYLIHYILEGKGIFEVNGITYHLKKGQGFLIEPDHLTKYESDSEEPWSYIWVGFSGLSAAEIVNNLGISQNNPVFTCEQGEKLKKYVLELVRHNHINPADNFYALGMFFLFISTIAKAQKDQIHIFDTNDYVQHAISYIHNHISEPMKIEEIADYVGLNRSYLSTLFKKHTGQSPLGYIKQCRITKARHLLESSKLSIESIAYSCGYQKPESLMKLFRQTYHTTPTAYRKQILERSFPNTINLSENQYTELINAKNPEEDLF